MTMLNNKKLLTIIMSSAFAMHVVASTGGMAGASGDVDGMMKEAQVCQGTLVDPSTQAPVDAFQAAMGSFRKFLGNNELFEQEAQRIAKLLNIEDYESLERLAGLYGLEVEIPLKKREGRSENVVRAATERAKNPESGLMIEAATKFLKETPIGGGEAFKKVLENLQGIEERRQAEVEGSQKSGAVNWLVKNTWGRFKKTTSKVANIMNKENVAEAMQDAGKLVREETEAVKKERDHFQDCYEESWINLVIVSINLRAALIARQEWLSTLLPSYQVKFQAGEISEDLYKDVVDNVRMLDRRIASLINLESETVKGLDKNRQNVRAATDVISTNIEVEIQLIPYLTRLLMNMLSDKTLDMRASLANEFRAFAKEVAIEGDKAHQAATLKIAENLEKGLLDAATVQSGFTMAIDTAKKKLKIMQDAAAQRLKDGVETRKQLGQFMDEVTQTRRQELGTGVGGVSPALAAPKAPTALPSPRTVEVTPIAMPERVAVPVTPPLEAEIVKPLEADGGSSSTDGDAKK
ncbi:MAG: hypothetical protein KA116_08940 [Proteobacteria bacterium]|nr:hypothetical protein [Pseudomonadota bacterium]